MSQLPDEIRTVLNGMVHGPDDAFGPRRAPWALFGSSVLLLHGLREEIGDVDVFVDYQVWLGLRRAGWTARLPDPMDPPFVERVIDGVTVHAFLYWTDRDPEVNPMQCRRTAHLVQGWWCTPLPIIRMHKVMAAAKHPDDPRQEKHRQDVRAIDLGLELA